MHELTRNKNVLDLVLSSDPAFIGISDHDAVLFNFNLKEIAIVKDEKKIDDAVNILIASLINQIR